MLTGRFCDRKLQPASVLSSWVRYIFLKKPRELKFAAAELREAFSLDISHLEIGYARKGESDTRVTAGAA